MGLKALEEGVLKLRAEAGGRDVAFLMMPFSIPGPIEDLAKAVRSTLAGFEIACLRADDKAYSGDIWDNITIYMHAADYGIAIFEQIDTRNYNPNISIEVGYLMALGTPLCLLKERRLPQLPSDIAGKLYFEFDIFDPQTSIHSAIGRWASSIGLSAPSDRAAPSRDAHFVVLPPGVGPKSLRRILAPLVAVGSLPQDELRSRSGLGAHSFSRHLGHLRASRLVVQAELPGKPLKLTDRGRAYYDALTGTKENVSKA